MAKQFVILHFPTVYSTPVGIWWWHRGENVPYSFYMKGKEHFRAGIADLLSGARNEEHWNGFAQKLADATPYADAFQSDRIDIDPRIYLKSLQRRK